MQRLGSFKTVFESDMIIYIENLKKKINKKTLPKLIRDYGKVAEYKINIQRTTAFVYTNNKQMELEIKNAMPFTLALSKNEMLKYRSNKICTRSVWGNLQNSDEQNQIRSK